MFSVCVMAFVEWRKGQEKRPPGGRSRAKRVCVLDQVQATLPPRSLRQSHTQVIRGVEFVIPLRVRPDRSLRQIRICRERQDDALSPSAAGASMRSAKEGRSMSAEVLTQARS